MSEPATVSLEARNLDAYYGDSQALHDVSIQVCRGEITSIVGSNGAGKTTLLRVISGLTRCRNGAIHFGGENITSSPTDHILRMGVALVPEGRRLFRSLTVGENLKMGAYSRNDTEEIANDLSRILEYFPVLKEKYKSRAMQLSGGQQQMLSVARALMSRPKLLMLDEPSVGVAPLVAQAIWDILRQIVRDGVDVLLVEQNASVALKLAGHAYVLENGRVVMEGDARELLASSSVRQAYLGL